MKMIVALIRFCCQYQIQFDFIQIKCRFLIFLSMISFADQLLILLKIYVDELLFNRNFLAIAEA